VNYLQYLLKAKGRHGTHSPFIYQFVAEALHEPKGQVYPNIELGKGKVKQLNKTLFRVLSYFKHFPAYASVGFAAYSKELAKVPHLHIIEPDEIPNSKLLLICTAEEVAWMLTQMAEQYAQETLILVLHPGNAAYPLMKSLYQEKQFNCTVFTWDFSLLVYSPDFKRKQHFILR
jgi:hypothetical protein